MNTSYLTLEQILLIHEDQIERYGGRSGLRDLSLLESATFRPQTTFDGRDLYIDIFEKAAALVNSLILNHPFVDGNKRTGVVSALVFLELNGWTLRVEEEDLLEAALKVATKKWNSEKLIDWIKTNSKPVTK